MQRNTLAQHPYLRIPAMFDISDMHLVQVKSHLSHLLKFLCYSFVISKWLLCVFSVPAVPASCVHDRPAAPGEHVLYVRP